MRGQLALLVHLFKSTILWADSLLFQGHLSFGDRLVGHLLWAQTLQNPRPYYVLVRSEIDHVLVESHFLHVCQVLETLLEHAQ